MAGAENLQGALQPERLGPHARPLLGVLLLELTAWPIVEAVLGWRKARRAGQAQAPDAPSSSPGV
jgi:hypothetical protein